MVRVLEHSGAQLVCENEGVTFLGKPETERETGRVTPLFSAAVIRFAPELP